MKRRYHLLIFLWKWINGHPYHNNDNRFFFIPALHGIVVNDNGFQQDAAIDHIFHATIDLLCQNFNWRLISLTGDVNWYPRICDLIPLNYFLWGLITGRIILLCHQTIDNWVFERQLSRCHRRVTMHYTLKRSNETWSEETRYCQASYSSLVIEIIFHFYKFSKITNFYRLHCIFKFMLVTFLRF